MTEPAKVSAARAPHPSSEEGWAGAPIEQAYLTRKRMAVVLGSLAVALAAVCALGVLFGSVKIDFVRAIAQPSSPDHAILFAARMPRVLMGAVVGAILAAVGAALQALVRNPLAEGGTLGISSGAAFGAIVALVVSYRFGAGPAVVPIAGFAAAMISTLAVYRLGQMHGRIEPFSLLLVGVIFNTFWSALILLINSVVNLYQTRSILFWLVGSLEAPTYREVALVGALGAGGFLWLVWHARDMNLLSLGDDPARDLGVEVDTARRSIFIATSLMIGAAVSVSGMIGFVGLIVPHILRLAFGADHRLLLPASLLTGAAFLVAADLAARVLIAPGELPVGVITALCGGPFFIYLLRREGHQGIAI
ncbi:MAG TPA: iron ABC transporter permease [Candidatus Binataceae bacterium]|nr:iron ABC transporter permease [Candidatus Binataceae bacterium]